MLFFRFRLLATAKVKVKFNFILIQRQNRHQCGCHDQEDARYQTGLDFSGIGQAGFQKEGQAVVWIGPQRSQLQFREAQVDQH